MSLSTKSHFNPADIPPRDPCFECMMCEKVGGTTFISGNSLERLEELLREATTCLDMCNECGRGEFNRTTLNLQKIIDNTNKRIAGRREGATPHAETLSGLYPRKSRGFLSSLRRLGR